VLVGHLVAGITLGDLIVSNLTPRVVRHRPYLAAVVGLTIAGIVGFVPAVGALFALVGFGAVMLLMWRVARGSRGVAASRGEVRPSLAPARG
jgi:hypothetical protein